MSVESITQLILQYRYWILIPLSLIEGPVVAFVAGTLAALKYFNIYFLGLFFFVRDVGLDGAYYALGFYGGKTAFATRMLTKFGITDEHLEEVRVLWARRPGWTMLIGKVSYGIASAFIVVAGMVKMPLTKFFGYGSLVAILQYGGLLLLGYFFGQSMGGDIANVINNIEYVIAVVAVALTAYYIFSFRMRKKLLEKAEEEMRGAGEQS